MNKEQALQKLEEATVLAETKPCDVFTLNILGFCHDLYSRKLITQDQFFAYQLRLIHIAY